MNYLPIVQKGRSSHRPGLCYRALALTLLTCLLGACQPSNQTPGQWLRGDEVVGLPADWTFTDEFPEIFVEVATPYFIPHSVTIWCAQVDGKLFIGAREPHTKRWPGWMEDNPAIRLKIDNKIYAARAEDFSDPDTLVAVKAAYAKKYNLDAAAGSSAPKVQYWAVAPPS